MHIEPIRILRLLRSELHSDSALTQGHSQTLDPLLRAYLAQVPSRHGLPEEGSHVAGVQWRLFLAQPPPNTLGRDRNHPSGLRVQPYTLLASLRARDSQDP